MGFRALGLWGFRVLGFRGVKMELPRQLHLTLAEAMSLAKRV